MHAIRHLLTPPTFSDPEQTRIARVLHNILVTVFVAVVLVVIMSLITERLITVSTLSLYLLATVGSFILSRYGYLRLASLIIVLGFLALLTYLLWQGNGIHDVAIAIYPIIVVVAGLLMDGRTLAGVTVLVIFSLISVVVGELVGVIATESDTFTPAYDLLVMIILLAITAVSMRFLNKDLAQIIAQLGQNEQALAQANHELRHEIAERKQAEESRKTYQMELQSRTESLSIINTITDMLHRSLDELSVAQLAAEALASNLQIPAVAVYTLTEDQHALQMIAAQGISTEILHFGNTLPIEGSLSGYALTHQEMIICDDIEQDERAYVETRDRIQSAGMTQAVIIPLSYLHYAFGVLNLFFTQARQATPTEIKTFSAVAKSISLALANARYVNQIEVEIQERKEAEQSLQAERDFAHQIMTNIGQGLTVTNAQGQFTFVNQAFTDISGYTFTDLLGKTPFDIAAPNETTTLENALYERLASKTTSYETRLYHADGHLVDVLVTGVGQWQGDTYMGSIAVITDLTERKEAEKAQLRFANQLRTAVLTAQQVNAILDPQELLPAVVGFLRSQFDLYHVHMYLLDTAAETLHLRAGSGDIGHRLLAQKHAISIHEKHSLVARAAREQEAIWVNDVSAEPDFMPNPLLPSTQSEIAVPVIVHGSVLGVLDVQEDAPDSFSESDVDVLKILAGHIAIALQNANLFAAHKEAEARLAELVAELETRNAELERFTYTVSHDLKSPLITIKGFLGLLQKDIANAHWDRVEGDMKRIRSAAETMDQLLHDLLALSRVGRIANPAEKVPFAKIVQEATERVAGQLAAQKVELVVSSDLPDVYVDRPRLVEVIQNLLDNAIKFMGSQSKPRIEIGTSLQPDSQRVLFVRDNGIGIDPRYHEKVFGLFDRLDPTIEGTGIGLALVRRIIEVHNGRIWIESAGIGDGTTFYFTLPDSAAPVEQ